MSTKIYINAGHSDKDPGAVGYEVERELNVKVSNYQKEYLLDNYECEVKMSVGSINSVSKVAEDANKWGANFLCSNHFNAGGGDGWEGLVYSNANVNIGKVFEKHVKAVGQNSRGVKLRPDLGVLRLTKMPAILNEGAFVDNKKDIEDWNDDAELKKLGIAYAKATAEVNNLKAKAKPATTLYRVQVGAFSKKTNAEKKLQAVKSAGFEDAYVTSSGDGLWRVQCGAFAVKANAEALLRKLMNAGFSGFITTK